MAHGIERNLHGRISGAGKSLCKCKKNQPPARSSGAAGVENNGLKGFDRQDLAALVVAARGAGAVRRDRTPTLAALAEQGGMKAVGGFARAQPHLGHLAFWNSHIGIILV
jgi:hypothetical protein